MFGVVEDCSNELVENKEVTTSVLESSMVVLWSLSAELLVKVVEGKKVEVSLSKPFGVYAANEPIPVTASQLNDALKPPLQPEVMSLNENVL